MFIYITDVLNDIFELNVFEVHNIQTSQYAQCQIVHQHRSEHDIQVNIIFRFPTVFEAHQNGKRYPALKLLFKKRCIIII